MLLLLTPVLSHLLLIDALAFGMPFGYEWLIIGLIGLLIFGKRLPGAARGIGEAFREFKRGMKLSGDAPAESTAMQRSARHD